MFDLHAVSDLRLSPFKDFGDSAAVKKTPLVPGSTFFLLPFYKTGVRDYINVSFLNLAMVHVNEVLLRAHSSLVLRVHPSMVLRSYPTLVLRAYQHFYVLGAHPVNGAP